MCPVQLIYFYIVVKEVSINLLWVFAMNVYVGTFYIPMYLIVFLFLLLQILCSHSHMCVWSLCSTCSIVWNWYYPISLVVFSISQRFALLGSKIELQALHCILQCPLVRTLTSANTLVPAFLGCQAVCILAVAQLSWRRSQERPKCWHLHNFWLVAK